MNIVNFALISVTFIVLLHSSPTQAHTFVTQPNTYNRVFQLRDCVGAVCRQACPPLLPTTPNKAARAKTWKRGQEVKIKWAKNNHRGGFVRFALVPESKMMSRRAHEKLALFHGCFAQGIFECSTRTCGADKSDEGYSRPKFRIPTIYPDGLYVFGLVWYGGLHFPISERRFFSDYWSCAYIRIEGGEPLGGSYQPFFDVGDNRQAQNNDDQCQTARVEPGLCQDDDCTGREMFAKPLEYQNGKTPRALTVADVRNV